MGFSPSQSLRLIGVLPTRRPATRTWTLTLLSYVVLGRLPIDLIFLFEEVDCCAAMSAMPRLRIAACRRRTVGPRRAAETGETADAEVGVGTTGVQVRWSVV
jgi:hypothetical protein